MNIKFLLYFALSFLLFIFPLLIYGMECDDYGDMECPLQKKLPVDTIYVKIKDHTYQIPTQSRLLCMSKFFTKQLLQTRMEKTGFKKNNPIVLKDMDSEQFDLIIESTDNIERLTEYLNGKSIEQIRSLFKASSYLVVEAIIKGVRARLKSFHDFNEFFKQGGDLYLGELSGIPSDYDYRKIFDFAKISTNKPTKLIGHQSSVKKLAYGPKEKYFFSASKKGRIKKWRVDTCKPKYTLPGNLFTFSGNKDEFFTCNTDGPIIKRDVKTGKEISRFRVFDPIFSLGCNNSGSKFIIGGKGIIGEWDVETKKRINLFKVPNNNKVMTVAYGPNEDSIFSLSSHLSKQLIKQWDIETGKIIQIYC